MSLSRFKISDEVSVLAFGPLGHYTRPIEITVEDNSVCETRMKFTIEEAEALRAELALAIHAASGVEGEIATDMPSLKDSFGCDPWDEENHGKHPASRDE